VCVQVVDEQCVAEAWALPQTWEADYIDMLMAVKDDQLDREVNRPFEDSDWDEDWPAAVAIQHLLT
jgi:hypothetical protein